MHLHDIQNLALDAHIAKKYLETWEEAYMILEGYGLEGIVDLAEVGLFTTEVAEALEEIRNKNPEEMGKELAGVVIRILNFASRKHIDLEPIIISEIKRNMTRKNLHGRKLI